MGSWQRWGAAYVASHFDAESIIRSCNQGKISSRARAGESGDGEIVTAEDLGGAEVHSAQRAYRSLTPTHDSSSARHRQAYMSRTRLESAKSGVSDVVLPLISSASFTTSGEL